MTFGQAGVAGGALPPSALPPPPPLLPFGPTLHYSGALPPLRCACSYGRPACQGAAAAAAAAAAEAAAPAAANAATPTLPHPPPLPPRPAGCGCPYNWAPGCRLCDWGDSWVQQAHASLAPRPGEKVRLTPIRRLKVAFCLPHALVTGGLKMLLEQMRLLRARGHHVVALTRSEVARAAVPAWSNVQVRRRPGAGAKGVLAAGRALSSLR